MEKSKIAVYTSDGKLRASSNLSEFPILVFTEEYEKGDYILLETEASGAFWELRLEDSMPPALVYLAGNTLRFNIPFDEQMIPYSPKSFSGALHMICARPAESAQVYGRRNLALNPYDTSASEGCFPHASANIETRGEAVFAARNTIDGVYANSFHGEYPYQSWGINRNPDAELRIDFGLPCFLDELRLTLRADFPHDNYWVQASVDFSDGSTETILLEKTELPQVFHFEQKRVEWVALNHLIPSYEPSPFPALTQIELWGTIAPGDSPS